MKIMKESALVLSLMLAGTAQADDEDSTTPIVLQLPLASVTFTETRNMGEKDRYWTQTITAHQNSYLLFETEYLNLYLHPFDDDGSPLSVGRYFFDESLELGLSLALSRSDEADASFLESITGGWVTYYQLLGSDFMIELSLGGSYEKNRQETVDEDGERLEERNSTQTLYSQGLISWFYSENLHALASLTVSRRRIEVDGSTEKSYGLTLVPVGLRVFL
jgi:hypothetical protein